MIDKRIYKDIAEYMVKDSKFSLTHETKYVAQVNFLLKNHKSMSMKRMSQGTGLPTWCIRRFKQLMKEYKINEHGVLEVRRK